MRRRDASELTQLPSPSPLPSLRWSDPFGTGGFAHVYLVKTAELINGTDRHVLKRVAVREKSLLEEVRREVEVMVGPSSGSSSFRRLSRLGRTSNRS